MSAHTPYGPVDNRKSNYSSLQVLPLSSVKMNRGFWFNQQALNHKVSLHHGYQMLTQNGAFYNFKLCAGWIQGRLRRPSGHDTDVYKWLEAVAWQLSCEKDEQLLAYVNEVVPMIEAAQAPDGYLNVAIQLTQPEMKWADLNFGHEMYTAGHLIQAAIAVNRALGDDRLLKVACRFADHIASVFSPGKRPGTCGHPEIETALVELYRETTEQRFLDLAEFLVNQRGYKRLSGLASYGPEYHQDQTPIRDAADAVGHAVRQTYLAAGIADLYMETGEKALLNSLNRVWNDISSSKIYITGGVGARFEGEAFGDPYELPTDQCYCETCAAIGNVMWNWRMLLITGESRYADVIEQSIYNAILCSPALDGRHYFYVNPLMLRTSNFLRLSTNRPDNEEEMSGRPAWHGVACCPPNVMRMFASMEHYFVSQISESLQIHQYAGMTVDTTLEAAGKIALQVDTDYPWNGIVQFTIQEPGSAAWRLDLRIPAWCENYALEINGQKVAAAVNLQGYLSLERQWHADDRVDLILEMAPRLVVSNPRVDATRGCAAIQRGPIVYCFESQDQPEGVDLLDMEIDVQKPLQAVWEEDLLGGIMAVRVNGAMLKADRWGEKLYAFIENKPTPAREPVQLTAIPYYAWGNRGLKSMRVWVQFIE
jgi:DUF1680 family protein